MKEKAEEGMDGSQVKRKEVAGSDSLWDKKATFLLSFRAKKKKGSDMVVEIKDSSY